VQLLLEVYDRARTDREPNRVDINRRLTRVRDGLAPPRRLEVPRDNPTPNATPVHIVPAAWRPDRH
jgi:hypothetical protein